MIMIKRTKTFTKIMPKFKDKKPTMDTKLMANQLIITKTQIIMKPPYQ
jgi:hypothetical protein